MLVSCPWKRQARLIGLGQACITVTMEPKTAKEILMEVFWIRFPDIEIDISSTRKPSSVKLVVGCDTILLM
jgi:hypothetical protein